MRWRQHNECTLRLWHDCFVIWPRKVHNTWVAFETIKRKGTLYSKYRSGRPCREWVTWEYEFPEVWRNR